MMLLRMSFINPETAVKWVSERIPIRRSVRTGRKWITRTPLLLGFSAIVNCFRIFQIVF